MSKRKKDAIWVAVLSIICCLIIWHVVYWHSTGMYLEMLNWIETDKAYISVLYNLGLMLALGTTLGFLMGKIGDLVGYEVPQIKHFDREGADNNR
ncbi:hypothetical protein ACFLUD_01110 [Chloroflexota bacterium]